MSERPYVTIVSGLPRSGTSMMMRMLECGGIAAITDNLRVADTDNPRGYYEFEPAKKTKQDASWVAAAPGKTVKMVYQLVYDLPDGYEYRVLFMRRKMEEVLASQKKMLDRLGTGGAADISDEQMSKLFRAQLQKFESWIASKPNFQMIDVDYNRMQAEPTAVIAEINDFLDGTLDTAAMQTVVEPELYRNRR